VLSAVVTTSASSATMNDATDVRASTQIFVVLSLDSFMLPSASSLWSDDTETNGERKRIP
jgi:hypothetical protein